MANELSLPRRDDPLGGVTLRQLTYLRAAARATSFTAAAAELGMSQPALSQALGELERRVGVALFEPTGRQRRLTGDGAEVAAFAERVLAEAGELRERLAALAGGEAGSLRVGMIDAASLYVLPGAIRRYRSAHPDVELELRVDTSSSLMAQLRAFELDVVFAVGPADADFVGIEVLREPLHLYAPPGTVDPSRPPADVEWALYEGGSRTRGLIDEGLARLAIRPRVSLESGNPQVLRQVVELGLGWSVLPPGVAEDARAIEVAGAAVRGPQVAERALVAMRRSGAPPHPRVAALLRLAAERTSGAAG
jgi:DNA-binding transcriptional LysR family regulator